MYWTIAGLFLEQARFVGIMLDKLEMHVLDFLQSHGLLNTRTNILVAVSGGADSVALLKMLTAIIPNRTCGSRIVVGHVNHRIRGAAADADEEFVRKLAAGLELDFRTTSVDVPRAAIRNRLSIETAARLLRINALIEMAAASGCQIVATAHHMNDNAETVLHRMLRGAGIRGLAGIRPARTLHSTRIAHPLDDSTPRNAAQQPQPNHDLPVRTSATFISPLLFATRSQIVSYCAARRLPWRHDHTNDDCAHTRNRIRHLLLPALQQSAASDLVTQIHNLSQTCRTLLSHVEQTADGLAPAVFKQTAEPPIVIDRQILGDQPDLVAVEILRRAIVLSGIGLRNMSESHYVALLRQARHGRPRRLCLPANLIASVQGGCISLERTPPPENNAPLPLIPLTIGGTTLFGPCRIETALLAPGDCDLAKFQAAKDRSTEWFDYDKIVPPLVIRTRHAGDRFRPLGRTTDIKVGKFLSACRIDPLSRNEIALIADAEKIIWVAPIRPSELTKLTPSTTRILQISILT